MEINTENNHMCVPTMCKTLRCLLYVYKQEIRKGSGGDGCCIVDGVHIE